MFIWSEHDLFSNLGTSVVKQYLDSKVREQNHVTFVI